MVAWLSALLSSGSAAKLGVGIGSILECMTLRWLPMGVHPK
jgi:hypothetical protein